MFRWMALVALSACLSGAPKEADSPLVTDATDTTDRTDTTRDPWDTAPFPPVSMRCEDPSPILDGGVSTGLVRCADGSIDRVQPPENLPLPGPDVPCTGEEESVGCTVDADCDGGAYGRCAHVLHGLGDACECVYRCERDGDCGAGRACLPQADAPWGGNACSYAECTSGADCASGACGYDYLYDQKEAVVLSCRTDEDSCRVDSTCRRATFCRPGPPRWRCQYQTEK